MSAGHKLDGHKNCQKCLQVMRWMDTNMRWINTNTVKCVSHEVDGHIVKSAGHEMDGHRHCQMSAGHEMD